MAALETEAEEIKSDKQTLESILEFLRKNNLTSTEAILKKELKNEEGNQDSPGDSAGVSAQELTIYKSEGNPILYEEIYTGLQNFIETCLDVHKVELNMILYPIFIHLYLELVYNQHEMEAIRFYLKFAKQQEPCYRGDLRLLCAVTKHEHMHGNLLMNNFKTSKFVIKMSRDSYNHLKRHLQEGDKKQLLNIIQDHLFIDVFDGVPRNQQQIDASLGGQLGEARREANKSRVYYGLLKEPDLNIPIDDDDEAGEGEDKPKKRRPKKDPLLLKKAKNDPNAPAVTRIPLPEMKDADKLEKAIAMRESTKKLKVNADRLPSICFYTFMNAFQSVTSVEISEDSSQIASGFEDSSIRIWSLTANKLRSMKKPSDLEIIDKETDDVLERIMDDKSASDSKLLLGHNGAVYATSFSQDRNYLISSSEDGTARLWSLKTWTNLVCYKGHNYPVWDCKFSPLGHYFVTGSHDRTARVWVTDHHQPLRIFTGHLADVDCVQFHPNCNYVATGSSDKTVRLWDMMNGECVRIMTGHKGAIHCLCFSPCGKYLASSGTDGLVILWELSMGTPLSQMKGHTEAVYSLCFSREGSLLVSGGLDSTVRIWDANRVYDEQDTESDGTIPSSVQTNYSPELLVNSYPTKTTPILNLHFTRRNLLMAAGPFVP